MKIRRRIFLLFTFYFLLFTLPAQNNMQIQWQGCYGGSEYDDAGSIVQTENGYLVLGTTGSDDGDISFNHGDSDIWLIKIDSLGNLLWERVYGGSETEYSSNIIKDNYGYYYLADGLIPMTVMCNPVTTVVTTAGL